MDEATSRGCPTAPPGVTWGLGGLVLILCSCSTAQHLQHRGAATQHWLVQQPISTPSRPSVTFFLHLCVGLEVGTRTVLRSGIAIPTR